MTRSLVNLERLQAFLERFGRECRGPGTVFVVGGGFDFYSQALAKIERGSESDLSDVRAMVAEGILNRDTLRNVFEGIQPQLVRYPGIDAGAFRAKFDAAAKALDAIGTGS
jgi:hypothetical protein